MRIMRINFPAYAIGQMQSIVLVSSSDRLVDLAAAPSTLVYPGVC